MYRISRKQKKSEKRRLIVMTDNENFFRFTRQRAINDFITGSGSPWRYWYRKYNFRCVRATQTVTTLPVK